MSWLLLLLAGVMEVVWTLGLKYTEGFSRLTPSIITIVAMILSMGMLGLAVKSLPIGTAYAIWTGIGTVGAAIGGIMLFGEPATALRLFCIALIVAGIVGLRFMPAS